MLPAGFLGQKRPKSANAGEGFPPSAYRKPELLAERPNEVWSWDITKLMGPTKWSYFYLYVILDIFSRRVVGWCVRRCGGSATPSSKPLFDDAHRKA